MPNDINKLRRLMRTAHVLQKGDEDHKYNQSCALKQAWWFESFRDALSNGFARFTYYKKDGTTRTALGTRSPLLIPADKAPKSLQDKDWWVERFKAIPYFDLDVREWRSFGVLNFVSLDKIWRFNDEGLDWNNQHSYKEPRWVSVEDGLPEKECVNDGIWGQPVLCKTTSNEYRRMRLRENGEWQNLEGDDTWKFYCGNVTHWMPIITPEQEAERTPYEKRLL